MKALRALVATGGLAATLAMGSMADVAQAAGSADKSSVENPVQAEKSKPTSFPTILVLCRPYQTCPP